MKVIATLLIVFCSEFVFSKDKIPISFAFDPWPPHHSMKGNKAEGLYVDIFEEILGKRMNFKILYNELPWKRCQIMVKEGEIDFMITVPNEDRLSYALMSKKPVYVVRNSIFTFKNHPRMKEIKSIKTIEDIKSLNFNTMFWSN